MTQLNSKRIKTILQEALNKDGDFLKKMIKILLQEIMEEEKDQPRLNCLKNIKEMRRHYCLYLPDGYLQAG